MVFYKGWSITMSKNRNLVITSEFDDKYILGNDKKTLTNEELLEILKKFVKVVEGLENEIQGN